MPEQHVWQRYFSTSESFEYTDEGLEYFKYNDKNVEYDVMVRSFFCDWGSMKQVSINKKSKCSKEPNMREKNFIIDGLNILQNNTMALEVFPKKSNIVDNYDLYHVWIIGKQNFPCYVPKTKKEFIHIWKKVIVNEKEFFYRKEEKNFNGQRTIIYYVKDKNDSELSWYEKQNFKDYVIGEDVIAVELIEKNFYKAATLICIPKSIGNLPFGLKKAVTN